MVGGCGSLPGVPIPPNQSSLIFQFHNFDVDSISGSYNFITAGASVHLGRALNRHLRCSFKNLFHLGREHVLDRHKFPQFGGIQIFQSPKDAFSATWSSCLCFFNDNGSKKSLKNDGVSSSETSGRNSFNRRKWTNVLLAINILVYVAHLATHGKLMLWGAKINGLIDRGQLWRLATSSFLHANIGHLLVNCYSLNSVGPTMESISGPKRYLAIYLSSAVTSSAMSYFLSKSPAVGASGAIFGLVGSVAVFVMRHRSLVGGGKEELQHIANVIVLNMAIGLMSRGIDNWGHLGGLLGGAATAWLLGPEWRFESLAVDGRRVFTDNAPIFRLMNSKSAPRRLG